MTVLDSWPPLSPLSSNFLHNHILQFFLGWIDRWPFGRVHLLRQEADDEEREVIHIPKKIFRRDRWRHISLPRHQPRGLGILRTSETALDCSNRASGGRPFRSSPRSPSSLGDLRSGSSGWRGGVRSTRCRILTDFLVWSRASGSVGESECAVLNSDI